VALSSPLGPIEDEIGVLRVSWDDLSLAR